MQIWTSVHSSALRNKTICRSKGQFVCKSVLTVLLLLALAGCGQEKASGPGVERFVDQTRKDFTHLTERLAPALASKQPALRTDAVLAGFLTDEGAMGGRSTLGIAVLNAQMNFIAGRLLSADAGRPRPIQIGLNDFSYLADLFKTADRRITPETLYFKGNQIFTVCRMIDADRTKAFVCLFYDAAAFVRKWGFDQETFEKIDFGR